MKKIFSFVIATMIFFSAKAQKDSIRLYNPERQNQKKFLMTTDFGINYTYAGKYLYYNNVIYFELSPGFSYCTGFTLEHHSGAKLCFKNHFLFISEKQHLGSDFNLLMQSLEYNYNIGYKFTDRLCLESGVSLRLTTHMISSYKQIPFDHFTTSSNVTFLFSHLAISYRISPSIFFSLAFAQSWITEKTSKSLSVLYDYVVDGSVENYRPSSCYFMISYRLIEKQRLILRNSNNLKFCN